MKSREIFGLNFAADVLPYWVADMDFVAPKELIAALTETAAHGIFGYADIPHTLKDLAAAWTYKLHNWKINTASIDFATGVMFAITATILALTNEGDEVLICQPVYGPMSKVITDLKRNIIIHDMAMDSNKFEIDFDTLKKQISSRTKLMLWCNPHNPSGRVWTKTELEKIAELCIANKIIICSNEIHSDLTYSAYTHIPMASLSAEVAHNTITYLSPSKTFNLGGMKISHTVISNAEIQKKVAHTSAVYWGPHSFTNFGISAFKAVYEHGHLWYTELMTYLEANRDYAVNFIRQEMPSLRVFEPQATYLLWIDCRKISTDERVLQKLLVEDAKIFLSQGSFFGAKGAGYMRVNFACPRSALTEGLQRMKRVLG